MTVAQVTANIQNDTVHYSTLNKWCPTLNIDVVSMSSNQKSCTRQYIEMENGHFDINQMKWKNRIFIHGKCRFYQFFPCFHTQSKEVNEILQTHWLATQYVSIFISSATITRNRTICFVNYRESSEFYGGIANSPFFPCGCFFYFLLYKWNYVAQ